MRAPEACPAESGGPQVFPCVRATGCCRTRAVYAGKMPSILPAQAACGPRLFEGAVRRRLSAPRLFTRRSRRASSPWHGGKAAQYTMGRTC